MKTYRLALIGFGNVVQGLLEILNEHGERIAQEHGAAFSIVGVSSRSRGTIYAPDGLSVPDLLAAAREGGTFAAISATHTDWSTEQLITDSNADVVVELSTTDLETGQPATRYIRAALESGKHVVTANKGPTALYYNDLAELAANKGLMFGVEGTVMSGTPSILLGNNALRAAHITEIQGILNGTTNYILTQMEQGIAYTDALADAQAKGYAEADPSGDVDGHDAVGKVVILGQLFMGQTLRPTDVDRTGIAGLTLDDIEAAKQDGERWKLIGRIARTGNTVTAEVKPMRLPLSHPLASVGGATNAITYTTKLMGDVTLIGAGAGRVETGYAILTDLLNIHQQTR